MPIREAEDDCEAVEENIDRSAKYMDYQVLQREADSFINGIYDVALFGAGSSGSIFCDWMNAIGQRKRIKYCLDNDRSKHETLFDDLVVYSPERLNEDPDITVVIASDFYHEIVHGLLAGGVSNKILIFDQRFPYCSDISEHRSHRPEEVYRHYNISDAGNKDAIDYCLFLRDRYKGGAVYSFDTKVMIDSQDPIIDYWQAPELELSFFDCFTIIDAGAFTGDSLQKFYNRYGERIAGYYAFEPNKENYEKLKATVIKSGLDVDRVKTYNAGVSDQSIELMVSGKDSGGEFSLLITGEDGVSVQTVAIDDLDISVRGKLCIKMDIEGFEMKALEGAKETISRYKPELAICVYHKNDDIADIPAFIRSIAPEYNTLLRCGSHMECYASVERFG